MEGAGDLVVGRAAQTGTPTQGYSGRPDKRERTSRAPKNGAERRSDRGYFE